MHLNDYIVHTLTIYNAVLFSNKRTDEPTNRAILGVGRIDKVLVVLHSGKITVSCPR